VLISQGLWNRRFAGDPKILGQTISLNGEAHTVIGIVGGFAARDDLGPYADVYVPFKSIRNPSNRGTSSTWSPG
jgi:putative ABC transport system permease protein